MVTYTKSAPLGLQKRGEGREIDFRVVDETWNRTYSVKKVLRALGDGPQCVATVGKTSNPHMLLRSARTAVYNRSVRTAPLTFKPHGFSYQT